jgi:2-phosphosulfolactate phosphatase
MADRSVCHVSRLGFGGGGAAHDVRFEWGPAGAAALAPSSSCLVVVDVLSFSTSVTVAVEAGTRVYPCAWQDESAAEFARSHQAELAVGRRAVSAARPWSLSPAALRRAPFVPRLVLPSPNGSAICAAAVDGAGAGAGLGVVTVIAGCLRNAAAVGRFLRGSPGPVTVIAAGERWPDGSLRPALEDLLGAGAILAALRGLGSLSPEAEAARACFEAAADVATAVSGCASGRELTEGGFGDDVAIAAEIDACLMVPVLTDGAFTAAPDQQRAWTAPLASGAPRRGTIRRGVSSCIPPDTPCSSPPFRFSEWNSLPDR